MKSFKSFLIESRLGNLSMLPRGIAGVIARDTSISPNSVIVDATNLISNPQKLTEEVKKLLSQHESISAYIIYTFTSRKGYSITALMENFGDNDEWLIFYYNTSDGSVEEVTTSNGLVEHVKHLKDYPFVKGGKLWIALRDPKITPLRIKRDSARHRTRDLINTVNADYADILFNQRKDSLPPKVQAAYSVSAMKLSRYDDRVKLKDLKSWLSHIETLRQRHP